MLHPIVEQMRPSPEQRPAIVARGQDVVVTAGAGTGKTRTLVARYLSLLAEGVSLRRIVAITFTTKAAREMRNRVREEVRRYLARTDLSPQERQHWQEVYTGLDAARISTIHSLCTEILRAHPAEAGVDPHFEVLGEGQINLLQGQALEEALAEAVDDAQAITLFPLLGEKTLHDILKGLLRERLEAQAAFDSLADDLLEGWQRALAQRQRRVLDGLRERPDWAAAVDTLQSSQASDPDDRMERQRLLALAAIPGAAGSLADQLASLACLDEINLSGGRQGAWPGGKGELKTIKAALKTLRELWRDHADLLSLDLNPLDETLARAQPALRGLFERAATIYQQLKADKQALDFDDLEQEALALLEWDPSVRERWQREVAAILVDEFQDTNGRQRDLIQMLNGTGGKLFIVGDAKQSIYRFRGADVAVFRAERTRIAREGGAAFALQTSYRAHRALVAGLNDLLRPVLGETADPGRPWAEPFAPLLHHRKAPGPGLVAPHVELHLTVGSKSGGALERAADALVFRLRELVEDGVQVLEGGEARDLAYGDVAILCRASTSFGAYEDALERAGVPFLTVAGRGFYERPEIRDLLNALQALRDPTDDLALAGLLRSPACALSDAALYQLQLCRERDQRKDTVSLWDLLQAGEDNLSGEDERRAQRAADLVARLRAQVGRTSVADLLKAFLDATDYRAALIRAGQTRSARNVAKLLADAHASGVVGVGEFLEYVSGLRGSGAREGEARATAEGAVQLMTVHAAKGLEFPVVALGDATYGRGGGGGDLLIQPALGVLLKLQDEEEQTPAIFELGQGLVRDQEQAESDRLLYVAATRAREKLILSGCIGLKKDDTPGKLGGWLGQVAGPEGIPLVGQEIAHDEDGAGVLRLDLGVGRTPVACIIYEPGYVWARGPGETERAEQPTHPVSLPPTMLEPVLPEAVALDRRTVEQERIPPQRVWRVVPAVERPRAPAWVIGSLVHEALAAWRFPGEGFERWAEARARGYGLTDAHQLADATRQSRRLLLRFQAHSLYKEMSSADRRLHEVPYSLAAEGQVDSGIIDALYLRDGTWTIVEFKTDRVKDTPDLYKLLAEEDYRAQAQRYCRAVERLLGQRPRVILCLLNYAGRVHLHPLEGGHSIDMYPWEKKRGRSRR